MTPGQPTDWRPLIGVCKPPPPLMPAEAVKGGSHRLRAATSSETRRTWSGCCGVCACSLSVPKTGPEGRHLPLFPLLWPQGCPHAAGPRPGLPCLLQPGAGPTSPGGAGVKRKVFKLSTTSISSGKGP